MTEIFKRTTLATGLLLLMPLAVMLSGWRWQPGEMGWGHQIMFWITETVTRPWGVLTSAILCGWFLWCLRLCLKPALVLLAIVSLTLLSGQYVKSTIKEHVQEPRPYAVWLADRHAIDRQQFYAHKRAERSEMVRAAVVNDSQIPVWLKQHWAFETGFAFPSGHTMFAATWALLGVALLWPRRHYTSVIILMGWATAVMASRLLLGMHWPRDLIVSTLLSGVLVTLAAILAQRLCGPLSPQPDESKVKQHENRNN
ncbi:phosphatidylglycerophosphatase B [Erwinia amylovora]|uniref:phosphatidylglycerophosphatase B n=1 Tax=Erwinia amylovora TaxID=552 RepID=UPI001443941F|nr:phosphatidylglycerophosphatase B [Erwinia amylovora]